MDAILSILTGDAEEWQRRAEVRSDESAAIDPFLVLCDPGRPRFRAARLMRGRGGPRRFHRTRSGGWSRRRRRAAAAGAEDGPAAAAGEFRRRVLGRRRLVRRRRRLGGLVMLSSADRERVAAAIRAAEASTAGEIVVVVARQASDYRSVPLLYGAARRAGRALAADLALGAFGASRIFIVQLAVALVLTSRSAWAGRRLALVPRFDQARPRPRGGGAGVPRRAGLTRTRGRTGVLIFVALAERYAEIVADAGIADRVDRRLWRDTIEELVEAIRESRAADGLIAAVAPRRTQSWPSTRRRVGDDADELPNKVIVI